MAQARSEKIQFIETTPENEDGPLINVSPEKQEYFADILKNTNLAREYLDLREVDFSGVEFHRPRGKAKATPHGTLPEKISDYLLQLSALSGGDMGPIGIQFVAQSEKESKYYGIFADDALNEREHEDVYRVVHKYGTRVLFILTAACDTMCRFCTREDIVGKDIPMSPQQIKEALDWIAANPEIDEIIFSGGDPLNAPLSRLKLAVDGAVELQNKGQISTIRFGTRLPIHNPRMLLENPERLNSIIEILSPINNLNIMLHINHPLEVTQETKEVLDIIRKRTGAQYYSQSVLLAGVNDDRETLIQLFKKIKRTNITPYLVFQNDEVPQAKDSTVPIPKGRELFRQIKRELSGLEVPQYVIDVKGGYGKIPVEQGYWLDDMTFVDYHGDTYQVTPDGMGTNLVKRADGVQKRPKTR